MVRSFVPVRKHFDVLTQIAEKESRLRRSYRYEGVVPEKVWRLKFRVGQEVRDAESGQRGEIIAATNKQVLEVPRS